MPHCYVHTVAELMTYLGKKYDNFVYSSIAKIWKLAKLFRTPHYKSIGKWRSARNAKIGTSFPRSGHRKTLKFAARSEHQNLGFQPRTKDSERVPILGIQIEPQFCGALTRQWIYSACFHTRFARALLPVLQRADAVIRCWAYAACPCQANVASIRTAYAHVTSGLLRLVMVHSDKVT